MLNLIWIVTVFHNASYFSLQLEKLQLESRRSNNKKKNLRLTDSFSFCHKAFGKQVNTVANAIELKPSEPLFSLYLQYIIRMWLLFAIELTLTYCLL